MKIIFWGTPKYAAENLISIVRAGQEVIAVISQPDRKRGRGKKLSPSPVKEAAIDCAVQDNTKEGLRCFAFGEGDSGDPYSFKPS